MLPEIFEDLCIRDDVVAIRFPGERLSAWRLEEANGGKYFPQAVDAVLAAQAKRDARFVVFDIRNLEFIGKSFLGCCVNLWKAVRQVRCQLVVICDEQTSEIFAIFHLDQLITVLVKESELQKLVVDRREVDVLQELASSGRYPVAPLARAALDGAQDALGPLADALEEAGDPQARQVRGWVNT